jgi:hypothetical protein
LAFVNWDNYLSPKGDFRNCRKQCFHTFSIQREKIRKLYKTLSPQNIVCLGAGFLNDIPIEEFIKAGSKIYLVDWVNNLTFNAINTDLIRESEGSLECMVCEAKDNSKEYCANFDKNNVIRKMKYSEVCTNFVHSNVNPIICDSFALGRNLNIIEEDVTLGRASALAEWAYEEIPRIKTLKSFFKKIFREIQRLNKVTKPLSIKENSIDFVTTSMVVSQFEHEPYGYISNLLSNKFGREYIYQREENLKHYIYDMFDALMKTLMDGHFKEIHRILHRDGRAYFSMEEFHRQNLNENMFWVKNYSYALEAINKYFWFDFDTVRPLIIPERVSLNYGESIVPSYVLRPKTL